MKIEQQATKLNTAEQIQNQPTLPDRIDLSLNPYDWHLSIATDSPVPLITTYLYYITLDNSNPCKYRYGEVLSPYQISAVNHTANLTLRELRIQVFVTKNGGDPSSLFIWIVNPGVEAADEPSHVTLLYTIYQYSCRSRNGSSSCYGKGFSTVGTFTMSAWRLKTDRRHMPIKKKRPMYQ